MHRWAAIAAVAAGVAWIPIRASISVTFSQPLLGLSYEDWNRTAVVPIALMLVAVVLGIGSWVRGSIARAGWVIAAVGLAGMLAGVIVEFWIAGGPRADRELSIAGWMIYLLAGIAMHLVGMVTLGIGLRRQASSARWIGATALGIGLLHALWIPVALLSGALLLADQVLIGVGWMVIGVLLWGPYPQPAPVARMGADVRDR